MTNATPLEKTSAKTSATVDLTQEIRFAVVMYGGSSLAVYMNGVAQELLRLVRSTALAPLPPETEDAVADGKTERDGKPATDVETKSGVKTKRELLLSDEEIGDQPEGVYRKLGRMLRRGKAPVIKDHYDSSDPVFTRFVIDILSGTSAGGINAVFLAKALVNDQDITPLKELWRKEGDIGVLINDKESDADINLGPQDPPRSLLNSRRMYYKLLEALQGMDRQRPADWRASQPSKYVSPFVEELDLFTTATDISGLELNIPLADNVARERRHLSTFNFRFSPEEKRNDFQMKDNPFLAFAARVTSAHPAPFEPMKLADIDEALNRHPDYRYSARSRSDDPHWRMFFEDYLKRPSTSGGGGGAGEPLLEDESSEERQQARDQLRDTLAKEFRIRPFSDGGVLDNSPFSFAIDQLQFRHTQLPVDRKLLYIEPVPEHPERQRISFSKPDALENAWLSLSSLPRYQFIRDDLLRLIERNRLVARVNRILTGVIEDEIARLGGKTDDPLSSYDFGMKTLSEMITLMGSAWGGYQRLRVGETTDELVKVITSAAGFSEDSSEFTAIRILVGAWRDRDYHPYGTKIPPESKPPEERTATGPGAAALADPLKLSQNWFLYQYDLKWRLRRLKFVMRKIDEIACFDKNAFKFLRIANKDAKAEEKLLAMEQQVEAASPIRNQNEEPSDHERAREELYRIKNGLSGILRDLQTSYHQLLSGQSGEIVAKSAAEETKATTPELSTEVATKAQQQQPPPAQSETAPARNLAEEVAREQAKGVAALENTKALKEAIDELSRKVPNVLERIMNKSTLKEREDIAQQILSDKEDKLQAFGEFLKTLNQHFKNVTDMAADRVRGQRSYQLRGGVLYREGDDKPGQDAPEALVRRALYSFYKNFDRYDMISYPILYATKVGEETDVVEIYRVSPEDAKVLIPEEALRERKLAGTALGNFAAFFYEPFRTNDLLWGRLDCADRIITALIASAPPPGDDKQRKELEDLRVKLIKQASLRIIADELKGTEKASLRGLLIASLDERAKAEEKPKTPLKPEAVVESGQGESLEQILSRNYKWQGDDAQDLFKMQQFLRTCLSGRDPLDDFKATASFDHEIPPATMVRVAARGSKVFGKMLEGIAEAHRIDKKRVVWMTRLTSLFWGLVEVAVPDSIPHLVFRHWLKLLYLFEFLLVLGGTLLLNATIQQFGLIAFAITGVIHLAVLFLGDSMIARPYERRLKPERAVEELNAAAGIRLDVALTPETTIKIAERFKVYETVQPIRSKTNEMNGEKKRRIRLLPFLLAALGLAGLALLILGILFVSAIFGADFLRPFVQKVLQPEASDFRETVQWLIVAVVALVFFGTIRKSLKDLLEEKRIRIVQALGLLASLLGIAIIVTLLVSIVSLRSEGKTLPGNLHQPALALEMARSADNVKEIEQTFADIHHKGVVPDARAQLKKGVDTDLYFIFIYTFINLCFCYLLWQRRFRFKRDSSQKAHTSTARTLARLLAIAAIVFALVTAAADFWENLRLYDVLEGNRTTETLAALRTATLIKWGASFIMIALLSALFLRPKRAIIVIGVLFLVIFAVGMAGLFVPQLLEWAFGLMGLGMIAAGLWMMMHPRSVVNGLRKPLRSRTLLSG
jgi:patatin-related protein